MKKTRVKNEIGYVSLVGFLKKDFPMERGNYFSLGGFHVLNMWYENFKHLALEKEFIDAIQFGENYIVIVDEEIPEDYLNNDPCFTGGGGMSQETRKDVYEFMYPRFSKLKCMCCSSAQYKSVYKTFLKSSKAGISLSKGSCLICTREVLLNNNAEVSQETWDKLLVVHDEAPSESGVYLAPWRFEITSAVEVESIEPNNTFDSRYATKKINSEFYGVIKIDDLKDECRPK